MVGPLRQPAPNPADTRPWVIARLLSVDTVNRRATVSIDDGEAVSLRYVPDNYTGITTVFVLMDPTGSGAGQLVLGPCGTEDADTLPPPPPAPPAPGTPSLVERTVVVRPTWSGTYRSIRSAWDRWNTGRYGGRSTLYQGDSFGSGPLVGLATYGNQIVALGAVSISAIVATTPLATGGGTVTLQGAPHAFQPGGAPTPAGSTASGDGNVTLPADIREALRTGAAKSLATVGGNYRATYGTSRADGLALRITYRRPA